MHVRCRAVETNSGMGGLVVTLIHFTLSRLTLPGGKTLNDFDARCRGVETKANTGGLAVTLIDFTLSRLTLPGGAVAFCDLSADPELFAGPKGDCQV